LTNNAVTPNNGSKPESIIRIVSGLERAVNANGVYESSYKLYKLEEKLTENDFLRASKNSLFNINHIQSIEPDLDRRLIMTMSNDNKLIVSRQYAAAVKEKLEAYYD